MAAPPPYPGSDKQAGIAPPPPGYGVPPPAGYQPMYGQPTAGYQPAYQQQPMVAGQSSVTVLTQPGIMVSQQYREVPVRTKCPACHAEVLTSTSFETGTFAWVIALVLCLFGLWLGCCLIPFCVDGCKDVVHSCPNCRHTIGKFNRM